MKKTLLFTFVFFTLFARTNGQEININFGFQAGVNLVNIQSVGDKYRIYGTDEDLITYSPAPSFNVNAYIEFKRGEKWNLSLEPGFIRKGAIENLLGSNNGYRLNLNYIQMPILANFALGRKTSLSIGPEIGYLINARINEKGIPNPSFDISHSYKDYQRFMLDLSGLLGFNYEIFDNTVIGIRYNHGLLYHNRSVMYSHPIGGQPTGIMVKENNQYLQLLFRYKL